MGYKALEVLDVDAENCVSEFIDREGDEDRIKSSFDADAHDEGVNAMKQKDFRIAECLPENLEYLLIRGYERGRNEDFDAQLDSLLAFQRSGLFSLSALKRIEEFIPNAEHVEDPANSEVSCGEEHTNGLRKPIDEDIT
ncbi:hypothetical protein BBP40_011191 [Aspergillus hancockii]|nr:hypothetical protein BBP40_011191 [Aspergillus hancockii]